MNTAFFIAKKLVSKNNKKGNLSSPIINIAVSAIAISVIMMIVSVATGVGLQQKIRQKIAAFSGHIIISNFDSNQSAVTVSAVNINQEFYPKFKTITGIKHIQAIATKAGIIRTAAAFDGVIFKGVGTDFDWQNLSEYLTAGKIPKFLDAISPEILISEYLASRLGLKIGDRCNTFFMKDSNNQLPNLRVFKIVGIYKTGFQDFDNTYIVGDIRHIQKINRWTPNQIGAFEVFIDNFDQIQTKGAEVYKTTNSKLNTQTIVEKFAYIFDWLQLFDFNIIIIMIIMIAVSTINMAVTLLVLILERTQTIGILKAIGASNWTFRKIFLYNAAYLVGRGLLWGNIIAIALLIIQQQTGIITLNPESYYVNQAPVTINIAHILGINLITIAVCMLVLIIPSYIITKISPIKAIRYQ